LQPQEREQLARLLNEAKFRWSLHARPEQLPPDGDWRVWLILAGRGWGKTRTGAETVRMWKNNYRYVNLIGATADDARDIMIEGESGILSVCPNRERPEYVASARKLKWQNGAVSLIFTADEPERLRGKQSDKIWADELGAWRYPESYDQARFGLRLGNNPQMVITTTPKPTPIIKELVSDPFTRVTKGSTYDNKDNLAPAFYEQIIKKYEGTRLGRQELNAEILLDNPGALWKRDNIDEHRVSTMPEFESVVVGVDPSATSTGDEAGVITVGKSKEHLYVLDDASLQGSPVEWAKAAVSSYHKHKANFIIAESNQGGEMVSQVISQVDNTVPVRLVHASRGKATRAEPVAAVYEQGRGHHVGSYPYLEDECCQWTPGDASPNRLDALVWACTELLSGAGATKMYVFGGN
jgi:phage terminase large subunit-like protein